MIGALPITIELRVAAGLAARRDFRKPPGCDREDRSPRSKQANESKLHNCITAFTSLQYTQFHGSQFHLDQYTMFRPGAAEFTCKKSETER